MSTVNIHEAKTHFSKFVDAVMRGEEVIIAKAGTPVVRLVAVNQVTPRKFGLLKGKVKISDDFDAPLPPDVLKDFEDQ